MEPNRVELRPPASDPREVLDRALRGSVVLDPFLRARPGGVERTGRRFVVVQVDVGLTPAEESGPRSARAA
jgi:hypothetical protein